MDTKNNFQIKLSKDLLTAYLSIFPCESDKLLTLNQIREALLNKGITYGIDEIKITIALANNTEVADLPVAHGKEPILGKNARILYHFAEKGLDIKPKELENGKVDFYNINLIQNVQKGQLLVEKVPPTRGISGIAVTGIDLPAPQGKDVMLPIGKNMYIADDNLKGYAECDGHVVVVDGKVSVLEVFEVNSDVDFSTGNINFNGNVMIKGNIKDGFSVKSSGDVEVYGTVEGGSIFADGNIVIKKGVRGLKKSIIKAKGNVYSNFIEHATIYTGKDLIVNEGIMHSNANSGASIQVGGRKGVVVGGVYRAGKSLVCKNIGSHFATLTTIEVGITPEIRLKYKDVCEELTCIKDNIDKTEKALKILSDLKNKLKQLPPDKEVLFERLSITRSDLVNKQKELDLLRQKNETEIKNTEGGYIKVSGEINCGVNISIGKANKHFTIEQNKVVLRQNGMDISIEPLVD